MIYNKNLMWDDVHPLFQTRGVITMGKSQCLPIVKNINQKFMPI